MNSEEITPRSIAKYIDHTNVRPDATRDDIKKLCHEAIKYGFHSVCVTPYRVREAHQFLAGNDKVGIICVVGFPFGLATTDEKIKEAKTAVGSGATEVDMIINIGAVKDANWRYVENEIHEIAKTINPIGLKVIMEIGFLTSSELTKACKIAKIAGAKFVKTSTGYGPRKPTLDDIKLMRKAVGPNFGVKASGGIHDFEMAKAMLEAGANRIGTSSGLQIIGVEKPAKKKERE